MVRTSPLRSCLVKVRCFRAPVIVDEALVFANNQEAKVLEIERSTLSHEFEEAKGLAKWTATIPT